MSSISVVSEYTPVEKALSVHAKNWSVPPKKEPLHIERQVKGHVTVKHGSSYLTDKVSTTTFDTPEDMLKGMRQETDKRLAPYRFPDQKSKTDSEKQTGKGMWSNELVRRILKANPRLFVEDSLNVPGCAGFYKTVHGKKAAAGIPNASFRHGFMPEATICKEDSMGLMKEFVYGWRQVLIRLRKSKDLSSGAFRKLYGVVDYNDERGKHFASDLGKFGV